MDEIERNLGVQPLDAVMGEFGLGNHDLVEASNEQITHKMVARARKGRRLTKNSKMKILNAVNAAVKGKVGARELGMAEIFNYR